MKKLVSICSCCIVLLMTTTLFAGWNDRVKGNRSGEKSREYYETKVKPKVENAKEYSKTKYEQTKDRSQGFVEGWKKEGNKSNNRRK